MISSQSRENSRYWPMEARRARRGGARFSLTRSPARRRSKALREANAVLVTLLRGASRHPFRSQQNGGPWWRRFVSRPLSPARRRPTKASMSESTDKRRRSRRAAACGSACSSTSKGVKSALRFPIRSARSEGRSPSSRNSRRLRGDSSRSSRATRARRPRSAPRTPGSCGWF